MKAIKVEDSSRTCAGTHNLNFVVNQRSGKIKMKKTTYFLWCVCGLFPLFCSNQVGVIVLTSLIMKSELLAIAFVEIFDF